MSKQSALEKYARLVEKRNEHIRENKAVFDEHEKIVFDILDAENDLRDTITEEFENLKEQAKTDSTIIPAKEAAIADSEYTVTVIPQTQTWADIEEVDRLIGQGTIVRTLRESIVKTQDRPPKITIRKN